MSERDGNKVPETTCATSSGSATSVASSGAGADGDNELVDIRGKLVPASPIKYMEYLLVSFVMSVSFFAYFRISNLHFHIHMYKGKYPWFRCRCKQLQSVVNLCIRSVQIVQSSQLIDCNL